MVSMQEYEGIQQKILSIIKESDASVDPSELLFRLRNEEGVPLELGSAILWEMIRADYLSRSEDWRVSRGGHYIQEIETPV